MRKLILFGTTAVALAAGVSGAYAVPQNSPYAVMAPPQAVDGYSDQGPIYSDPGYGDSGMIEGRAAVVDPDYGYDDPGYAYGYGYGYDPAPVGGFYFGGGGGGRGGHFRGHSGGGHFGGGGARHVR
ncbi:MAG: hypothetical protein ABSG83_05925 [Roseiarcus sp.]|jgi:hypothetical protein